MSDEASRDPSNWTQEERDIFAEYERLAHAMQSGVAMKMNYPAGIAETQPKHVRVGVNSALCDAAALGHLLIMKGLVTRKEYLTAIRDQMRIEVESYQAWIRDNLGIDATLG